MSIAILNKHYQHGGTMSKKKPQQLSWLDLDKIEVTDNPRILALLGISKLDDKIKPFRAQRKMNIGWNGGIPRLAACLNEEI